MKIPNQAQIIKGDWTETLTDWEGKWFDIEEINFTQQHMSLIDPDEVIIYNHSTDEWEEKDKKDFTDSEWAGILKQCDKDGEERDGFAWVDIDDCIFRVNE